MQHITETDLNGLPIVAGQTAGEGLIWDGANWVNSVTPLVKGGGTLDYVPKFTPDGETIGDSQIFDDASNVGINNAAPDTKLDVSETNNTTANSGVLKLRNTGSGVNYTETAILFNSSLNGNPDFLTGRLYAKYDSMSASDCRITLQSLDNTNTPVDTLSVKNKSVGVGINTPLSRLHVKGLTNANTDFGLKVENLAGTLSLQVRDDGSVYNLGGGSVSTNTAFGDGALTGSNTGVNNTAFGKDVLKVNTTGQSNIGIGNEVLLSNVDGGANTAIGLNAMRTNITGDFNVALGYQALYTNNNNYNVAIGYQTMYFNSSGSQNTGVGSLALQNSTGSNNVAVGISSLQTGTSMTSNTAIGANSGFGITTGDYNVFVGESSGLSIGTGSSNVFLGNGAGYHEVNTSNSFYLDNTNRANLAAQKAEALMYGIFNAAVANQRLTINGNVGIQGTQLASTSLTVNGLGATSATFTAKYQNSSGLLSLQVRDDGSVYNLGAGSSIFNIAFGYNALISNTSGTGNSAFGYEALKAVTSGNNNTAFGSSALPAITTSSNNVGVGLGALLTQSSGAGHNTAIGYFTLQNTTSGYNTAVGWETMKANTTGTENAAFGGITGASNTTGSYNTYIGVGAGNRNSTGNSNVFLGYTSGYYETGSNKLFIDNASRTNEADGRVKALVYGEFAANSEDQRITFNSFVRVKPHTVAEVAAGVTPANGDIVYVSDTDATFTSVGFWGYVAGAWIKLNN